jgi:glyoxylase-like metal-dependent hydrolase (beta-lactamase superfamily II)
MPRAQEVDEVSPGIFVWQVYDSKVKADLFSTALETHAGTYVVDPIPLESDGLLSLWTHRKAAGIFVTNANHARAAAEFAKTLSIPIYAHGGLRGRPGFLQATWVQDGEVFSDRLTAVAIDGGPAGETALSYDDNGGTMVVGDALINFEPHGFALLPAKYCLDCHLMRRSLRKLLDYTFDRMLFAHGTPILCDARARVERLLGTIR